MKERIAERGADGRIHRVLERELSPAEELLELYWPPVRDGILLRKDLGELPIFLGPLPAGADAKTLIDGLRDRLVAEGAVFKEIKSMKVTLQVVA
jgi:hypothetical protein